jgi:ABC-type oligopeptide transport system substrate-binding subunit/DNA-binding SARP family transcriptional activator
MGNLTRLRLLGPIQIERAGKTVRGFESHKALALLGYLAAHDHPLTRAHLADLLWSDKSETRARGNLRRVLHNLAQLLPDCLTIERDTVQLCRSADFWVDLRAFEELCAQNTPTALTAAAELYRDELMAGIFLDDAPEFETWLVTERERWRGRLVQVLRVLIAHHTERGEYAQGLRFAARLLALDPWREEAHRSLMRLFALSGQRSDALAQYETCRRTLAQELHLEPDAETNTLFEQIRDGTLAPPRALPSIPALPFVGRANEHATCVRWWESLCEGHALSESKGSSLLLVEGEAGVGKTRLVEEVTRYIASRGTVVLRGRCYEFGGALPYQPIAEALRAASASMSLAPATRAELARLLPEWRDATTDASSAPNDETGRLRLFQAVAQFLRALGSRSKGVCLFLDDLHWADSSTLDLVRYLITVGQINKFAPHPFGIIGTYRPEEIGAGHPLTQLRQALSRDHRVERVRLQRLPANVVAELARGLIGTDQGATFGTWLYRESEGNPFVLIETLYALHEQGVLQLADDAWSLRGAPPDALLTTSVQDVILQRVERMSASAQQLLTLAAVIGRQFDTTLLQTAVPTADVSQALEEWFARHLVEQTRAHALYDFTHDKIRAAIYDAIPLAQRRTCHRQVAIALEQTYRGAEQDGLLASHWEQAGEVDRAIDYWLRAGDRARLLYAEQEASTYYRRALAHLETRGNAEDAARTWMKLGLAYHNAFDFARAREAYAAGFALWQRASPHVTDTPTRTLRVRWEEPRTLDPLLAEDAHTSDLIAHLFSGLVEINAEQAITPDVARTWEISNDGRTFTFHLRDDAHWSDGVPVTADDFVFAWRRALDPKNGLMAIGSMAEIVGAEAFHRGEASWDAVGIRARDPRTLELALQEPAGYFLYLLAHTPYQPLPRHIVEMYGDAWCTPEHFISNGPFTLEHWDKGYCLALKRHTGYHGAFTGNVARVEMYTIADPATRLAWYEADRLDVLGITYFPAELRARARQHHATEYLPVPRFCTNYLVFDVRQPPFDDVRVRRAFALATNRAALADEVLQGYADPATGGLVPQGMSGHAAGIALPYAPERARQLLAEAGYADGRGFPVVRALAFSAIAARAAYLQTQWQEQLGIKTEWDVGEWSAYVNALRQNAPALFAAMWTADYPDPDDFLRVSRNDHWSAWYDARYETSVEQARRDNTQATRLERYAQAEQILVEQIPMLPLTYEREHLLVKPWVRRYPCSGSRSTFWQHAVV